MTYTQTVILFLSSCWPYLKIVNYQRTFNIKLFLNQVIFVFVSSFRFVLSKHEGLTQARHPETTCSLDFWVKNWSTSYSYKYNNVYRVRERTELAFTRQLTWCCDIIKNFKFFLISFAFWKHGKDVNSWVNSWEIIECAITIAKVHPQFS